MVARQRDLLGSRWAVGCEPELVPMPRSKKCSRPEVMRPFATSKTMQQSVSSCWPFRSPLLVQAADHPAVVAREHLPQLGLEGTARVTPVPAELCEDGVATLVVAGDRAAPRCVPRGVLVHELGERLLGLAMETCYASYVPPSSTT